MRYLRLVTIVWLPIVALIGSMTLYARTTSRPSDLEGFGFGICDGRVCFMGITPGVTKLPDAMAYLEKNGGQCHELGKEDYSSQGKLGATYWVGELRVIMDYSPDTLIVESLYVLMLPGLAIQVQLGDVVRYWGLPCGFSQQFMSSSRPVLLYPYLYVYLDDVDKRISPDTRVEYIWLIRSPDTAHCDSGIPWLGFISSEWYRNWKKP